MSRSALQPRPIAVPACPERVLALVVKASGPYCGKTSLSCLV
jgi:hypothetical protein